MSKKIVLAWDGRMKPNPYEGREDIQQIIRVAEDYGYEVVCTYDDGLFCEGGDHRSVASRIEHEGPNWVKHSEEYLKIVEDADILVVLYNAVGKQLLERAKKLKYIACMRSGVENIDMDLCREKGILVSNCPGKVAEPVSEMACAMILDVVRGITYVNKKWKPGDGFKAIGARKLMKENVIGLVGFGIIARKVAHKLNGFNCKFIAYDPFVKKEDAEALGVELVELNELMARADIISVHARLLPATQNLVGAEQIALMKPNAYLINTARAGLVDEEALIQALVDEKIQGAALDVFREEPLPDEHVLRTLDNVIITPHMAGGAGDVMLISLEMMFEEIVRYMKDEPLKNLK